jgi:hypothetical protein
MLIFNTKLCKTVLLKFWNEKHKVALAGWDTACAILKKIKSETEAHLFSTTNNQYKASI